MVRQTCLERLPLQGVHLVHLPLLLVALLRSELLRPVMGCLVQLHQLHRQVLDSVRQLPHLPLEGLHAPLHLPVYLELQEPQLLVPHFRQLCLRHLPLLSHSLLRQLLPQVVYLAQERNQQAHLHSVPPCHLQLLLVEDLRYRLLRLKHSLELLLHFRFLLAEDFLLQVLLHQELVSIPRVLRLQGSRPWPLQV